jgi:hypothetical protein
MDILSFILGIALVVVIGLSIVAVISFVKVRQIEKQIEYLEPGIFRALENEITGTHRRIDELELGLSLRIDNLDRDFNSQLDSRLDKLENKLITKK